jgi:hypothetical protein
MLTRRAVLTLMGGVGFWWVVAAASPQDPKPPVQKPKEATVTLEISGMT